MKFGFSYIGFIFLLMLVLPNIIWGKNKPKDYDKYVKNENKVLLLFERAGEVLVICAFCLLSVYGRNPFLFVATIILEIGHIGIHLSHKKEIE